MNIEKLHAAIAAICPIDGLDSSGKIYFKSEATEAQKEAARELLKNWQDVPDGKKWTPYEFRNLFTQQERFGILNSTDAIVKDLWSGFSTAQEILADHPETITGMAYLVEVGLITESRKNEILN